MGRLRLARGGEIVRLGGRLGGQDYGNGVRAEPGGGYGHETSPSANAANSRAGSR
jgi:hypothetical protein